MTCCSEDIPALYVCLLVLRHANILKYKEKGSTVIYHHTLTLVGEKNYQQQHLNCTRREQETTLPRHRAKINVRSRYEVPMYSLQCWHLVDKETHNVRLWEQGQRYFMWWSDSYKIQKYKSVKLTLCFYFQKRWWSHCIMSLNMCAIWKAICVTSTDRMTGLIDSI